MNSNIILNEKNIKDSFYSLLRPQCLGGNGRYYKSIDKDNSNYTLIAYNDNTSINYTLINTGRQNTIRISINYNKLLKLLKLFGFYPKYTVSEEYDNLTEEEEIMGEAYKEQFVIPDMITKDIRNRK